MTVEQSLLGKDTNYPTEYQPDILFPIARAAARETYAHVEGIQQGKDRTTRMYLELPRYTTDIAEDIGDVLRNTKKSI